VEEKEKGKPEIRQAPRTPPSHSSPGQSKEVKPTPEKRESNTQRRRLQEKIRRRKERKESTMLG